TFHLRDEGDTLLEALDEALEIGRASRGSVHLGHFKTFRKPNWHKLPEAIGKLEAAMRAGLSLTVDRYPHLAMNTQLKFSLPLWALEGGTAAMKARLKAPESRKRIIDELSRVYSSEERELMISLVSQPQNRPFEGRFLDELGTDKNVSPLEVLCDVLADEGEAAFATFFGMSRDNLDRILQLDYAMVASDASVQAIHRQSGGGRPHPRCFDTFPSFLAEWVFTRRLIPLETAVQKITSMPADRAGLIDRGRLVEGACADLVCLSPDALGSAVSYEEPIRFPAGVDLVMVNGQVVIDHGRLTGARPGTFLRWKQPPA
ncbi:MAG: amidohydrolase family protein, partial [Archangium sp.]|nr:amidohydrolase family protein [Archangium sp.]